MHKLEAAHTAAKIEKIFLNLEKYCYSSIRYDYTDDDFPTTFTK